MYNCVDECLGRPLTVWAWLWHHLNVNRQNDSARKVCFASEGPGRVSHVSPSHIFLLHTCGAFCVFTVYCFQVHCQTSKAENDQLG